MAKIHCPNCNLVIETCPRCGKVIQTGPWYQHYPFTPNYGNWNQYYDGHYTTCGETLQNNTANTGYISDIGGCQCAV